MRGVAVAGGFRLNASASYRCLNPHPGHGLSASRRSIIAFRQTNGVGSHNTKISGLSHTACSLAVYA